MHAGLVGALPSVSPRGEWHGASLDAPRSLPCSAALRLAYDPGRPRTLQALAGLVVASSHFDAKLANSHYARMELMSPPDDAAMEDVDAEALEFAPLPLAAKRAGAAAKRVDAAATATAAASKRSADEAGAETSNLRP